jgi:hypothetical protein
VARLHIEVQQAERVIQQTARRLLGERVIADRIVSLSDADARPIRRGRPHEPTERFRAGCEDRISHLKRRNLRRVRPKGHGGAQIWAAYGVLAHNFDWIVTLL